MKSTHLLPIVGAALLAAGVLSAQTAPPRAPAAAAAPAAAPAKAPAAEVSGGTIVAQQLVDEFGDGHAELSALEIALLSGGVCKTIAATSPEDVGATWDAGELAPMHTGEPNVEMPTKDDPGFYITLALHDASGKPIGMAGMDISSDAKPTRAEAVTRAKQLLKELEAQIPSAAKLTEQVK